MKPLISYYGGKQRLASKIVSYLPSHNIYVEPFCGGAAVLFAKGIPYTNRKCAYKEVINDTQELLINMYRQAILHKDEFEIMIQSTMYSQSDHKRSRTILKNPQEYNDLDKAWAYFFNINTSFANKLFGGWGISRDPNSCPSQEWITHKQRISAILNRISAIHASCEDALDCIKRWDSPNTLFYVDPPYINTDCGHYKKYSIEDYKNLCNLLDTIQGKYVLSGYQQEIEPKSFHQKISFKATMSAAGAGKTKLQKKIESKNERVEIIYVHDKNAKIFNLEN
jgi:DNA adenine methylase